MVEPSPPNPVYMAPAVTPPGAGDGDPLFLPPSPPSPSPKRPPWVRVTSEFDSGSLIFFHKVSCKVFDNLAKLKLSFNNNTKREISHPHLALTSKHLSVHYNVEDQEALIKTSFHVAPRLHFKTAHFLKAQQSEVTMVANLADPGYALELSSPVPYVGLPRATFKFPIGEVSLEGREDEEVKRTFAVNGIIKGQVLNGVCAANYKDEELKLRYTYKDEALSFIPSISLPSNALSFSFKRRFSPSDKLSYWYNFDSNYWSLVYKHKYGKDFKFKAGYDSEVRAGWASLWVGEEGGRAKTAPMKLKVQFTLQVPQDDIKSSALMFRVKKRWDI
ncbi:hypothetical protein QQP08_017281 [Theobroma cacao]|uniref:Chloroplast outer envelope protein 37 isoform 2 n=1 Tax=Theobroma cacao TaxID=3641 RepID=A0A061EQN9_THECC|nr:Chloroplast outer envelope protein 37 isoform 2 [Theobroma cacao]WRX24794.1 hypothetical protein QQP08_017281 [Theobroma cacao]